MTEHNEDGSILADSIGNAALTGCWAERMGYKTHNQ